MALSHPRHSCVLAIVGSRDAAHYASEAVCHTVLLDHAPRAVVSGGARGVDTVAMEVAAKTCPEALRIVVRPTDFRWSVPYLRPSPDVCRWRSDGVYEIRVNGGFKERDARIAQLAECLVRLESTTTKTHGAEWTAREAERLGNRSIYRYTVPGTGGK